MERIARRRGAQGNEAMTDAAIEPASRLRQQLKGMSYDDGAALLAPPVMRKASGGSSAAAPADVFRSAARGGGSEVPYRSEMEQAFGADFGGVRAHLGQGEATKALGAEAAAMGEDVVFRSASPDREVVAHELTHVMQKRQGGADAVQCKGGVSEPGEAAEVEADRVAARVVSGQPAGPIGASPAADVSRQASERPAEYDVLGVTQTDEGAVVVTFDSGGAVFMPMTAVYLRHPATTFFVREVKAGGELVTAVASEGDHKAITKSLRMGQTVYASPSGGGSAAAETTAEAEEAPSGTVTASTPAGGGQASSGGSGNAEVASDEEIAAAEAAGESEPSQGDIEADADSGMTMETAAHFYYNKLRQRTEQNDQLDLILGEYRGDDDFWHEVSAWLGVDGAAALSSGSQTRYIKAIVGHWEDDANCADYLEAYRSGEGSTENDAKEREEDSGDGDSGATKSGDVEHRKKVLGDWLEEVREAAPTNSSTSTQWSRRFKDISNHIKAIDEDNVVAADIAISSRLTDLEALIKELDKTGRPLEDQKSFDDVVPWWWDDYKTWPY